MIAIRFKKLTKAGIVCAAILAIAAESMAGEELGTRKERESGIREAGKAYVQALRRGDAQELAALWTAEGTYTDATGRSHSARELIEQHFGQPTEAETSSPVTVDSSSSIRFITPDVAIEEGITQAPDAAQGKFTAIWVKTDESWMLDSLSERAAHPDSHVNPLDDLSWMVGDWLGKSDGLTISCSGNWSDNKKFIVRHFAIERAGDRVMSATQRIGWDPGKRAIRSWVFHSDGSIDEGRWLREGDAWIVKNRGVLPDGSQRSAISFWLREGEDRCAFKSHHLTVGGEKIEDSVVEFRRVTAAAE